MSRQIVIWMFIFFIHMFLVVILKWIFCNTPIIWMMYWTFFLTHTHTSNQNSSDIFIIKCPFLYWMIYDLKAKRILSLFFFCHAFSCYVMLLDLKKKSVYWYGLLSEHYKLFVVYIEKSIVILFIYHRPTFLVSLFMHSTIKLLFLYNFLV